VADDHLDQLDPWERHLCEPLTGRKIICAFEVLAGMTTQVSRLRRWQAQRPLLLADGLGTGPLPLESDADIVVLEPAAAQSLTEQVRARIEVSRALTPTIVSAVEQYDPEGSAAWWVSPVGPNEPLLDRIVFGGRPSSQIELEDKLALDPILQATGVQRPATETAGATYDELVAASARVADASGSARVVWAGDNRDGVNGGGDYIRVVGDDTQAREAAAFFAAHCDLVRVTPMFEGVPCSIHAIVLPDGVVVLRPVELVNLRDERTGRFFYGGMGTTWDPPADDTAMMRTVAADVGRHLQRVHGLRGAFGLDGVLTADGFRVTEMNPRFSGGFTRLANAAPDLHLDLLQLNALIGRDVGRSAADIEAAALADLNEHRIVDAMGLSAALETHETSYQRVVLGESGLEPADGDEGAIGTVLRGAATMGTFVRLTVDDSVVDPGQRCAPLAMSMLEFADQMWGTGFGPLTMAPDVRTAAVGEPKPRGH
jgi:hypothetical protein